MLEGLAFWERSGVSIARWEDSQRFWLFSLWESRARGGKGTSRTREDGGIRRKEGGGFIILPLQLSILRAHYCSSRSAFQSSFKFTLVLASQEVLRLWVIPQRDGELGWETNTAVRNMKESEGNRERKLILFTVFPQTFTDPKVHQKMTFSLLQHPLEVEQVSAGVFW